MWAEYIDERTIRPAPRNGFDISNLPLWFDKYPEFAAETGYHRVVEANNIPEPQEGFHGEFRYNLVDGEIEQSAVLIADEVEDEKEGSE